MVSDALQTIKPDLGGNSDQGIERVSEAARALAPRIAARAAEIEAARRLPLDLVEEVRGLGVFRMLTPRRLGGLDLELGDTLSILEELAIGDGSAAWVAMIGCHGPLLLSLLPDSFDAIYAQSGPDLIHGGSTRAPADLARQVPGGWQISGRWGFASGCQHADWMVVFCLGPSASGSGPPLVLVAALPATAFRIIDSWDAVGLRGTGSHDISLEDVFVPESHCQAIDFRSNAFTSGIRKIALQMGAVAVGIAEGALRDVAGLATMRRNRGPKGIGNLPIVQYEIGQADALVKAARSYLHSEARNRAASDVCSASQAAVWASQASRKAIDVCFAVAGTHAIHAESPLQRRVRDIHVLMQHGTMRTAGYAIAGARRMGLELNADPAAL